MTMGDRHPAPARPPHRCPAKGCPRANVPDDKLMCGIHWRLVPGPVQRAVYDAWRNGAGRGSRELLAAQLAAVRAVNHLLEGPPDNA